MPTCHRCQRPVAARAIACPHCHAPLKAFGHPGIELHRATGDEFLCDRCAYHADDSCTYPQRPYATTCTLFRDANRPLPPLRQPPPRPGPLTWLRRHRGVAIAFALVAFALVLALVAS